MPDLSMRCRRFLSEHSQQIPLQELKQKRNRQCHNEETLGGYPLYQFDEKQLSKKIDKLDHKTYCFRPDQLQFVPGSGERNPYTGQRFHTTTTPVVAVKTLPLSQLIQERLCPLDPPSAEVDKRDYVFVGSVRPLQRVSDALPFFQKNVETKETRAYFTVKPTNIFSLWYYLVELKKPIREDATLLHPDNIQSLSPLYKRSVVKTPLTPALDHKIRKQLEDFFRYRRRSFTQPVMNSLEVLGLKLPEPVSAFRGLFFPDRAALEKAGFGFIYKGEEIEIDSRALPMSWSTDPCVSEFFATSEPALVHPNKEATRFGVILRTVLEPDQVLLDTRLIDPDYFLSRLYTRDQAEIITKPYKIVKRKKIPLRFKCHVARLFLMDEQHNRVVVRSFSRFLA